VLEDSDELAAWAREAHGVALAKRGKRRQRRPTASARRRSKR
jgi:hypothetical protein